MSTQTTQAVEALNPVAPGTVEKTNAATSQWRQGVSICIPAYNEAEIITETVQEAALVLSTLTGDHEIIVVDDGSTDDTWDILQRLAQTQPFLRPLQHERNLGIGQAQRTLVSAAKCEYVFHIGADRQWRMDELIRMLEIMDQGNDVVIGVRVAKQYTLWRSFVSSSFNRIVAFLWGKHFGDLGSIKLIRTQLWKQVPFGSSSAFVHAQRLLIAYQNGARVATTPVEHLPRLAGSSKFTSPLQAFRAMLELVCFRLSKHNRTVLPEDWRERTLEA